jgi:hypothetical protein
LAVHLLPECACAHSQRTRIVTLIVCGATDRVNPAGGTSAAGAGHAVGTDHRRSQNEVGNNMVGARLFGPPNRIVSPYMHAAVSVGANQTMYKSRMLNRRALRGIAATAARRLARENARLAQENARLRQAHDDLTGSAAIWIHLYERALTRARDLERGE